MTDEPEADAAPWAWRKSLIDLYCHAIPTAQLDPRVVYTTACGTGLADDLTADRPAAPCPRCVAVAGPMPRPPVPEGRVAWWSGPATGHPNDFSHAFAAEVVNDATRRSYQALGCDYTVLASEVTPFPLRPLCVRCLAAAAVKGLIPELGAWR